MLADEEIAKMTIAERVDAMERLWASFPVSIERPSPAWHEEILNERMAKMDSPDAVWLTMEELQARWDKR